MIRYTYIPSEDMPLLTFAPSDILQSSQRKDMGTKFYADRADTATLSMVFLGKRMLRVTAEDWATTEEDLKQ